jgi:ech hydrogenase subunit A
MLVLLPLGFIGIYKTDTRRIVPVYMSGENTGDNKKFNGALNVQRRVELRNWYMVKYFGDIKLSNVFDIICTTLLCIEFLMLIWGGVL